MQLKFPNQNLFINKLPYLIVDSTQWYDSNELISEIKAGKVLNYDKPFDDFIILQRNEGQIMTLFEQYRDVLNNTHFSKFICEVFKSCDLTKLNSIDSQSINVGTSMIKADFGYLNLTEQWIIVIFMLMKVDKTVFIQHFQNSLHSILVPHLIDIIHKQNCNFIIQCFTWHNSHILTGLKKKEIIDCLVETVDGKTFYNWY